MGAEAKSNKAPSLPHVPSGLSGILGYSSGAYNSSTNPILRQNQNINNAAAEVQDTIVENDETVQQTQQDQELTLPQDQIYENTVPMADVESVVLEGIQDETADNLIAFQPLDLDIDPSGDMIQDLSAPGIRGAADKNKQLLYSSVSINKQFNELLKFPRTRQLVIQDDDNCFGTEEERLKMGLYIKSLPLSEQYKESIRQIKT